MGYDINHYKIQGLNKLRRRESRSRMASEQKRAESGKPGANFQKDIPGIEKN